MDGCFDVAEASRKFDGTDLIYLFAASYIISLAKLHFQQPLTD